VCTGNGDDSESEGGVRVNIHYVTIILTISNNNAKYEYPLKKLYYCLEVGVSVRCFYYLKEVSWAFFQDALRNKKVKRTEFI